MNRLNHPKHSMKLMRGCMALAVVAIALIISGVGAGALFIIPGMLMMGAMMWMMMGGAGGWIFMALGNIIIWSLIIAFIIWLARDLRTRPHRHHITSGATASEILDRRLASGEITPEPYQQLHTTLTTKPGDPARVTGSTAGGRG